jgi:hypothetical protein
MTDILIKYQRIKQGNGFFQDVWNFFKGVRDKFNPDGRKLLEQYGGENIKQIILFRSPLESGLKLFLNWISDFRFTRRAKELAYDDVFHVGLILVLINGTILVLEKTHVPTLRVNNGMSKSTKYLPVNIGQQISLNDFIQRGVKMMGNQYWSYSLNNNCQKFAMAHLNANGINTPELTKFILQNDAELLKSVPNMTQEILNTILNIVTRGDQIIKGTGIPIKIFREV